MTTQPPCSECPRTLPPRWLAVLPILTHMVLLVLDSIDRAAYQGVTWSSWQQLLAAGVDSPLWMWAHLGAAIYLAVSTHPPHVIWAYSASASVLGAWGLAAGMTGVLADHPVSLVGPALVILIAGYAHHVARLWSRADHTRRAR